MPKTSKKPGKSTGASVQSISKEGLWLIVGAKEYFLSHRHFPWFKGAAVADVLNVTLASKDHLFWPQLDVDLHLHGIEHPEKYPVLFNAPELRKSRIREWQRA